MVLPVIRTQAAPREVPAAPRGTLVAPRGVLVARVEEEPAQEEPAEAEARVQAGEPA